VEDDLEVDGSLCIEGSTGSCDSNTDGNLEVEDGSMCIGDNGCTAPTGDGNLLIENEIHKRLESLSDWIYSKKQISKEFKFADFKGALAFVNKVGNAAEGMDHHPDILMHSWNKVKISISTHSEGEIENL